MSDITGISRNKLIAVEREAQHLVAKFDTNRDDAIDLSETRQVGISRQVGLVNKQVRVYFDYIDEALFRLADKNRDGKLTGKEMVRFFLEASDLNGDGHISYRERNWKGPFFGGLTQMYEHYGYEQRPAAPPCH